LKNNKAAEKNSGFIIFGMYIYETLKIKDHG